MRDGGDDLGLAVEEAIDVRRGHPGIPRDFGDRRLRVAVAAKERFGGGEDAVTAVIGSCLYRAFHDT